MNSFPFVSVIMPVRNEASFIERGLGAVFSQDYPADRLEVLVADGMSTDATREIVRSLQNGHPQVRLIDNLGRIVPTGLNAAMAQARGDIIVRVDGHCEIAPDYVRRCVDHLLHDGVDGVGGPLETIGDTLLAKAIATAMSSTFGVGGSAFRTVSNKTMLADTVAFPAYTRRIMDKAGGFDEELVRNQDDEYNYRLRKLGGKILLAANVQARYYSRTSLRSLWRQYFQYGYWKVRVLQKHPRQMQPRQFVPPLFVAALLFTLLLTPISPIAACLFGLAIVGSYLVVNLAASVLAARQTKWRLLPHLPIIFTVLHLSYGLGFLTGLVSFWNRWKEPNNPIRN
jgi:cellulose synthase/poly-beta-1,6-N-acetylglucosamine synthase-like glycosyltransferase